MRLDREGSGDLGLGWLDREDRRVAQVGDRERPRDFRELRLGEGRLLGGSNCSLDAIRENYVGFQD